LLVFIVAAYFFASSNKHIILRSLGIVFLICSTVYIASVVNSERGKPIFYKDVPAKIVVHGNRVFQKAKRIEIMCSLEKDSKTIFMEVPYNKELEKALKKGSQSAPKGKPFVLTNNKGKGSGKSKDGKDGKGKGKQKGDGKGGKGKGEGSLSLESNPYATYNLPPALLPPKNN